MIKHLLAFCLLANSAFAVGPISGGGGGATLPSTSALLKGDGAGGASAATAADITDSTASLLVKPAVAVVAVANLTLSGEQTIDGQLTSGSLVLATAQTTGSQNGFWVTAAGAWTRPVWYPSGGTAQAGQFLTTFVRLGTVYGGSTWRMTTASVTIDTTATAWAQTSLSTAASLTGPSAITITAGGTAQNINLNPSTTGKVNVSAAASTNALVLQQGSTDILGLSTNNGLVTVNGRHGYWYDGGSLASPGNLKVQIRNVNAGGVFVSSDALVGFHSATSISGGADSGMARSAAGVVEINNGTIGGAGSLKIGAGTTITKALSATATLDFTSTSAQSSAELTITLTGAVDGDDVIVSPPNGSTNANTCFTARVSSADTVSVKFNNYSSGAVDPASGTFRVSIIRF